ncbi:Magnesium and cobalt efflux protein CorC [Moraxella catarrhalis]|nr:CNNM domain-containing protein [Moraxella catarrhalis]OAV06045.1 Magnesium and cobalt efflux protein CorC [Moraxella catarrhalis]
MPRPRTQNLANLSFVSIAVFTVSVAAVFIPSTAFAAFELGGTPTNLALLIFFICLSLVVSFLCSISEATLLTMTPSYIDTLEEDNPKGAALLKSVKVDHIEKSISAILTLNTVAHTLGSLGAGAQAVIVFGMRGLGCSAV